MLGGRGVEACRPNLSVPVPIGRVVRRHRAVEGRARQQSAPEGDLPGGLRATTIIATAIYSHRRRHEARQPAGVDGGEPARSGLSPGLQQVRAAPAGAHLRRGGAGLDLAHVPARRCEHPTFDAFWRAISTQGAARQDQACRCFPWAAGTTISCRATWKLSPRCANANGVNRILIGPWPHNMSVPVRGRGFRRRIRRCRCASLQLQWFDQWLMGKDSPLLSQAAGEDLRHGRQPVARGARMAARAGARQSLVPG